MADIFCARALGKVIERPGPTKRIDQWVEIHPGDMYPATIEHIKNLMAGRAICHRRNQGFLAVAKQLPPKAWELALSDISPQTEEEINMRAVALELARRIYQNCLLLEIGPYALTIKKDPTGKFRYPAVAL